VSHSTVVEIGPGKGAITGILAERAQRLIAIELDRELAPQLRERFRDRSSVSILEDDVLQVNFEELCMSDEKLVIVGNLPYYITSDILLHLFEHQASIARAVIMIQREVADRVAAAPGTRDYGLLSATAKLYARVEKLMTLPPRAFSPQPEVHSTVLRLTMASRFNELQVTPEGFIPFLKACFAQKRKTLGNNLRAAGWKNEAILAAFEACEIPSPARAEELELEVSACLFRTLTAQNRQQDHP